MTMSLTDLPPDQRPRERLQTQGPQALCDAELLALLLRNGTRGRNAVELAAQLLAEHGGPAGLATARPEELSRGAGIGLAKAAAVVAAFHLAARANVGGVAAPQINGAADVAAAARGLFVGARTERTLVLVCDTQDRVRRSVFVSEGAVDEVMVPIREVLNTVLRFDGRAFAVVHNHPSGDPRPSWDDVEVTRGLAEAARVVGLRFLGHVVVAGDRWSSAAAVRRPQQGRKPAPGLGHTG
jgi:DNA repair protein RadC